MPFPLDPNHPKQKLLFFVAQDLYSCIRANVRDFVVYRLASLRPWLLGPPQFVDSVEEPEEPSGGDTRVETLGAFLEIYSALPPLNLPREVDLQHLEEVTALVSAIRDFSREHNLAFEFELDGKFVGAITGGEMDRSLSEGLLGEWRRHLE